MSGILEKQNLKQLRLVACLILLFVVSVTVLVSSLVFSPNTALSQSGGVCTDAFPCEGPSPTIEYTCSDGDVVVVTKVLNCINGRCTYQKQPGSETITCGIEESCSNGACVANEPNPDPDDTPPPPVPVPELMLYVQKAGTGTGTVTGGGISCGSNCQNHRIDDSSHTWNLTATAASGSTFSGWSGCTPTGPNTCSIRIDAEEECNQWGNDCYEWGEATVTATFDQKYINASLTVSPTSGTTTTSFNFTASKSEGNTSGTIYYTNPQCGTGGRLSNYTSSNNTDNTFTCTYSSPGGKTARVTVSQGSASTTPTASVTVNPTITVRKDPTDGGTITSSPTGINCDINCTSDDHSFPYGSEPTLTVVPNISDFFLFNSWSGAGMNNCADRDCQFMANANRTFTANFYGPYRLYSLINPGIISTDITYRIEPERGIVSGQSCGAGGGSPTVNGYRFTCNYSSVGYKDVSATITRSGYSVTPTWEQTIEYPAPYINNFKSNPEWISRESSGRDGSGESTLSWAVTNAVSCDITGGELSGYNVDPSSGTLDVSGVDEATVYTLRCVGVGVIGGTGPSRAKEVSSSTRVNILPIYQEF